MAKRFCCRNNLKKTKEHCHSNLPRHQKNSDRHQIVTSYTSNMPHPDNTTQHDTSHYSSDQYDSNDDEDYSNVDSEINEGVWRFMKTPRQANLAFHLNAVDKFLFDNFKEEIDVVTGRVFSKINTSSDIMNQIVNLFVDPLISGWLDAANASNLQDDVPLTDEDMRHFIKTLAYLSFYGKTPTVFFGNARAFPPASRLSLSSFRRVLKGLSKPSCDQLISICGKNRSKHVRCHRVHLFLFGR